MKHEVLSLDFWQKTTIYGDKSFPCGTIGCDALNVPAEVLDKLAVYCSLLNALLGTFNAGCGDPALLPATRESVKQMAELLKDVKPFSYVELPNAAERIDRVFSEESLVNANAYTAAFGISSVTALADPQYEAGRKHLRILAMLGNLYYSLGEYQRTMTAFAEKLNAPEFKRTPENIAALFGKCFPEIENFAEGDSWMAMTNATLQYTTVQRPGGMTPIIVKRMLYVTFVGMFRSDLYEGLCVGHAPKKCRTCGRWFLTINARPTKYCNGSAPGDKRHRSCRQVGNLKGRKERELAEDNPNVELYKKRLDSINHRLRRKNADKPLGKMMKKLAKDKMQRSKNSVDYANGNYIQEMELDALEAEARSLL